MTRSISKVKGKNALPPEPAIVALSPLQTHHAVAGSESFCISGRSIVLKRSREDCKRRRGAMDCSWQTSIRYMTWKQMQANLKEKSRAGKCYSNVYMNKRKMRVIYITPYTKTDHGTVPLGLWETSSYCLTRGIIN